MIFFTDLVYLMVGATIFPLIWGESHCKIEYNRKKQILNLKFLNTQKAKSNFDKIQQQKRAALMQSQSRESQNTIS